MDLTNKRIVKRTHRNTKSERPTRVLTPRVGLSNFSRRQAALKQELVFALLAVDGRRP
jgi:hypothetical protein